MCYCIWSVFAVTREDADINHLYCCILLVFFLHALLTMTRSQEHKDFTLLDSAQQ